MASTEQISSDSTSSCDESESDAMLEMQFDAVADNCEDFLAHRLDMAASHYEYCDAREIIVDYLREARDLIMRITKERSLAEIDCARLARLRALLDAMWEYEPHHKVVWTCLIACGVAEGMVCDLGLAEQLASQQTFQHGRLHALRLAGHFEQLAFGQAQAGHQHGSSALQWASGAVRSTPQEPVLRQQGPATQWPAERQGQDAGPGLAAPPGLFLAAAHALAGSAGSAAAAGGASRLMELAGGQSAAAVALMQMAGDAFSSLSCSAAPGALAAADQEVTGLRAPAESFPPAAQCGATSFSEGNGAERGHCFL